MKTSNPIINKLLKRIHGRGRGVVFNSADFLGIGSRSALDQALSRLTRQGVICRLAPGLYHYPRTNLKMGVVINPLPDAVAQAVARKTGRKIVPCGALAANVLGLSTQVPTKAVYLTNGQPLTVRYGSQTIVFRYVAPRTVAVSSKISAIVFQALRYLGRDGVTEPMIRKLKNTLSSKDKQALKKDIHIAMGWMKPVLIRIVDEGEDNG